MLQRSKSRRSGAAVSGKREEHGAVRGAHAWSHGQPVVFLELSRLAAIKDKIRKHSDGSNLRSGFSFSDPGTRPGSGSPQKSNRLVLAPRLIPSVDIQLWVCTRYCRSVTELTAGTGCGGRWSAECCSEGFRWWCRTDGIRKSIPVDNCSGKSGKSLPKVPSKSIDNFLSNQADKQTDRQTDGQTDRQTNSQVKMRPHFFGGC